jgi:hypothetical protein
MPDQITSDPPAQLRHWRERLEIAASRAPRVALQRQSFATLHG